MRVSWVQYKFLINNGRFTPNIYFVVQQYYVDTSKYEFTELGSGNDNYLEHIIT
jgi:hypothetical protein